MINSGSNKNFDCVLHFKLLLQIIIQKLYYNGARGETRTLTPVKAADFESAASTIPPLGQFKLK